MEQGSTQPVSPNAVLAIGYVRASTDKQHITLEAQESKIRQMAALKEYELSEVIIDGDASAKSLERPGMERLLWMIDNGEVSFVIIAKLDRLTRSVKDLAELLSRMSRSGVSLISVEESLDTGSAAGRLVLNIMCSISQWEREIIGERTSVALRHLKSQGFAAGHAPYGYMAQPRTESDRNARIRKPLVPNPKEQLILALVENLRQKDTSFFGIAALLNDRGYRTREDGKWSAQSVHRIWSKHLAEGLKVREEGAA